MAKSLKIILALIVLLAVPAGVYLVVKAGSTKSRAKAGQSENVFVFMMPSEVTIQQGEKIDVAVKIDTGSEVVGGIDLLLSFDPDFLALVGEVKPGSAFPKLTSQMNPGRVSLQGKGNLVGQGTVAVVNFEGINRGEGIVELNETSVVWDREITNNILGKTNGSRLTIE